jgi:hypothetical protein
MVLGAGRRLDLIIDEINPSTVYLRWQQWKSEILAQI